TMADVTTPTGQAQTMAPPIRTNDQILPRIRWVQTGYLQFSAMVTKREVFGMPIPGFGNPNTGSVTSFGTVISFTDASLHLPRIKYWNLIIRLKSGRNFRNLDNKLDLSLIISVTSFGTVISFTDAFSASPSNKKLESRDTLEDMKDLPQPG
nr:hypothetical protein [Tanacetum cinerariifolium]